MTDFEQRVLTKLDKIESTQTDFHGRLVSIETKLKLAVPFFTFVFTAGWSFIKIKILGMKG